MRSCTVSIKDGKDLVHTVQVEAQSLFHAAEQALDQWRGEYWLGQDCQLEVRSGKDRWQVSQKRVLEWAVDRQLKHLLGQGIIVTGPKKRPT
jgi:hypothetical protein